MGIEKLVEKVAGAIAADQALEVVDPNAGILAKGAAAVAGFEGVNKVTDLLEEKSDEQASCEEPPAPDSRIASLVRERPRRKAEDGGQGPRALQNIRRRPF